MSRAAPVAARTVAAFDPPIREAEGASRPADPPRPGSYRRLRLRGKEATHERDEACEGDSPRRSGSEEPGENIEPSRVHAHLTLVIERLVKRESVGVPAAILASTQDGCQSVRSRTALPAQPWSPLANPDRPISPPPGEHHSLLSQEAPWSGGAFQTHRNLPTTPPAGYSWRARSYACPAPV